MQHLKSLGYRKLANIRKSIQIRNLFVQKNKKNCFCYQILGKITSPQTVFFPNFLFSLLLTLPTGVHHVSSFMLVTIIQH